MLFKRKFTVRGRSPVRAIPQFYRQLIYGVVLLCVLGLIGTGIWHFTRLPSMTIATIEVVGGETVPHNALRTLIEAELSGSYLHLIPYRFLPFYPADAIRERIEAEPRVRQAVLENVDATTIRLTFSEYRPIALWCADRNETTNCYFIDAEGYAFAPAPPLRGTTFIRYIFEADSNVRESQIMGASLLGRMTKIIKELSERYDFRVQEVVFTAAGDEEFWLGGGSALKVAATSAVSEVLVDLDAIIASKEFSHLEPGNFSYIDLRFKNKAFVNETMSDSIVSSSTATSTTSNDLSETP